MKWDFDNASRLAAFGFGGLISEILRWPHAHWQLILGFGALVGVGLHKMEERVNE